MLLMTLLGTTFLSLLIPDCVDNIGQHPREIKSVWRMACVISVNLPDFHAKKSGKLDNPTNIDERHSDKQASRERPDPSDCLVWRIVFDQSLSDFPVCRIFFCVCRIVLLARLLFDGLAQKSWQKPKNLINFHKNDYWAKSSWQNRENGISKLLSGRFYYTVKHC